LSLAFPHHDKLIGVHMREAIGSSAGPMDFNPVGLQVFSQPKVQSPVVAGKPIPSGPDAVELDEGDDSYFHECANPVSITLCPHRLHL
jgi:hypothetical protein